MAKIAIITGASSGLGRAYARHLAAWKRVDEVWLIARRTDRLQELAKSLPKPCLVLGLDLGQERSFGLLQERLRQESPTVMALVCAAGLGKIGANEALGQAVLPMVDVNVRALTAVTNLCLPYLGHGALVLELGSAAGFLPLPGLGVYAATKAYVRSYARSLRRELAGRGVRVCCVCPYWVKDTEFIAEARRDAGRGYEKMPLATGTEAVVRRSLRDAFCGHAVSTPGLMATAARGAAGLLPEGALTALAERWGR